MLPLAFVVACSFVLSDFKVYGPVKLMSIRSVYLLTMFLDRLRPTKR